MKTPIVLQRNLSPWLGALVLYVGILFFKGYVYGDYDQIDVLSYARYLNNPNLYPGDFFMEHTAQRLPNERWALASLLAAMGNSMEWGTFLLHAGCSLGLLVALYRIALHYLKTPVWAWIALFLLFFPFSFFNLGGNDLYYNMLLNSNVSKCAGAWALWYFLKGRYGSYTTAILLATWFHPLAGVQLFLITMMAYGLNRLRRRLPIEISVVYAVAVYLGTAGIYLYLLFAGFQDTPIAPDLFMDIVHFRSGHHFLPSQFGWKNIGVMVPLLLVGVYFFRSKKDEKDIVPELFAAVLVPAIIYTIMVEGLGSTVLLTTQWFKTTIWIKALAVIGLTGLLMPMVSQGSMAFIKKWLPWVSFAGSLLVVLVMLLNPQGLVGKRVYHFPFARYKNVDYIDIALKIKEKIPENALFVQPAGVMTLKYFGERSSYVDIKAPVHSHQGLVEWYKRVGEVYAIQAAQRDPGIPVYQQADALFYQKSTAEFQYLASKGVTHVLTRNEHLLDFPVIVSNNSWRVYSITR